MTQEPWLEWVEPVQPEWIDYNGHLNEAFYVHVFGHATDGFMDAIGLGPEGREALGASLFSVEAHVRYLDQVSDGDTLQVRTAVVGRTGKAVHLWHEMWVDDTLRATEEVLALYFDMETGRSAPFPDDMIVRIDALLQEPPEASGRRIALR